jgi:hypothetical protein
MGLLDKSNDEGENSNRRCQQERPYKNASANFAPELDTIQNFIRAVIVLAPEKGDSMACVVCHFTIGMQFFPDLRVTLFDILYLLTLAEIENRNDQVHYQEETSMGKGQQDDELRMVRPEIEHGQ